MSLTSMLKEAPVKAMLREAFPVERVRLRSHILASAISGRPSIVGAAFDYLLRFKLEHEFAGCITRSWVAEGAVAKLDSGMIACGERALSDASAKLDAARSAHRAYMESGVVGDGLLAASLDLAQLNAIFRTGTVYDYVDADPSDMADLRGILDVAEGRFPVPTRECYLNPHFGDASHMVGGADADIVADGMLVDIKTTRTLSFGQDMYNQLVGYYVLSRLGMVNGTDDVDLSSVGIYYARYGLLHAVPTAGIRKVAEDGFMDVFEKAARLMFRA